MNICPGGKACVITSLYVKLTETRINALLSCELTAQAHQFPQSQQVDEERSIEVTLAHVVLIVSLLS